MQIQLTNPDLTSKRPGTGVSPELMNQLIGRQLKTDLEKDVLLKWENIN